jgi:hypothetical protein
MRDKHMPLYWHCTAPNHESMVFLDGKEFKSHVRSAHDENITESVLSLLATHSMWRRAQIFRSCPFCGGLPEEHERRYPNQEYSEAQEALQKHVSDHLMAVALILPPIRDDLIDGDASTHGSESAQGCRSAFDLDEAATIPIMNCDRTGIGPPCDCGDKAKNSVSDWSTFEFLAEIAHPTLGLRLLENHNDPSYRPLPRSQFPDLSELEFEWGFCGPISLPPLSMDISPPPYAGHLEDDVLATFVKRSPPPIQYHGADKYWANTNYLSNQTFSDSIVYFGTGSGSFKMLRPYHLSIVS